jgi:hypothetical protein
LFQALTPVMMSVLFSKQSISVIPSLTNAKCQLSPQLHLLFHGDTFIINSILEVRRFVSTGADDGLHVIVLDVSVQSLECLCIRATDSMEV